MTTHSFHPHPHPGTKPRAAISRIALLLCLVLLPLEFTVAETEMSAGAASATRQITFLLDDFHAAAAEADRERYLNHFAPNGVFMGTDDWERWPLAAFAEYVQERFAGGVGWSYRPTSRHIAFADDGRTAWFDEIMVSERWGRFRGTGVLIISAGEWKLAHYSLTALVPNEAFEDVSTITKQGFATRSGE